MFFNPQSPLQHNKSIFLILHSTNLLCSDSNLVAIASQYFKIYLFSFKKTSFLWPQGIEINPQKRKKQRSMFYYLLNAQEKSRFMVHLKCILLSFSRILTKNQENALKSGISFDYCWKKMSLCFML